MHVPKGSLNSGRVKESILANTRTCGCMGSNKTTPRTAKYARPYRQNPPGQICPHYLVSIPRRPAKSSLLAARLYPTRKWFRLETESSRRYLAREEVRYNKCDKKKDYRYNDMRLLEKVRSWIKIEKKKKKEQVFRIRTLSAKNGNNYEFILSFWSTSLTIRPVEADITHFPSSPLLLYAFYFYWRNDNMHFHV